METIKEMGIASDKKFPNLKEVFLDFLCTMTGNEVAMLNFLMGNASSLKKLTINLPHCLHELRNKILGLQKAFPETEVTIEDKKELESEDCLPFQFSEH